MSEPCRDKSLFNNIKSFISKLKVVKQTKQTNVMNDEEILGKSLEKNNNVERVKSVEEIHKIHYQEGNSSEKFKLFCEEIENFINYIKNNEDLSYYIYKYPEILQKRINIDVDELQSLLAEIKETSINIKKLRSQRKLIKKETTTVKKTVKRIKDKETRELESTVAQYDKDLYARWAKSKWKSDALEELLLDVQEKQVALESLYTLINRYIAKLKENKLSADEESEENSTKDKIIPLSSSMFSFQSKIPVPPPTQPISIPRPVPLTVSSTNRNNSRLSWVQRRFRAERRGNFATARSITENHENEPYIFSFNMSSNGNATNTASNFNPFEINTSTFSCNSIGTISSDTSNNQINLSTTTTRRSEDDTEVKSGIQAMLQTLFGERTVNPVLMITNSSDSSDFQAINEENHSANEPETDS